MTLSPTDWDALRRTLSGALVLPGDADYERARQSALRQYDDIRPQAVAYCASPADVAEVLAFGGTHALPTVPRSGGHSYGGYSSTEGLVLDVSRINHIRRENGNVVVGAGTQSVDLLRTLDPHGVAVVAGACPNVAIGGFLQGGGMGWLTRRYGLGSDRLVAATVVLPDGRAVRASPDEHPDLFWALQGNGGGNFGVVTEYEVRPVELTSMVMYALSWPYDAAARLLEVWQPWALGAPVELGAGITVTDGDPERPGPQVDVHGSWLGSVEDLDALLDALVAEVGVKPLFRGVEHKSFYAAMMETFLCQDLEADQCYRVGYSPEAALPRENFFQHRNRMFDRTLPAAQIGDLLDQFASGRPEHQFRLMYVDAFGGVANEPDRTATAYVHRTTQILAGFGVSLTDENFTGEDVTAAKTWLAGGFGRLDPGSLGESYQNFIDPDLEDWKTAYYAENWERLTQVREQYDPEGFFRFARAVD
ncbi:FAD-binding oxidoreductase [Actinomadura flavalba]|uniref:FAD-binding oxidoreductase n=1 Tax=Actinomadura flavalba TaxID=1120938 RepID=UPI000365954C|nr:FAD-binding oxidoreductase [Actinomadura flavalba]